MFGGCKGETLKLMPFYSFRSRKFSKIDCPKDMKPSLFIIWVPLVFPLTDMRSVLSFHCFWCSECFLDIFENSYMWIHTWEFSYMWWNLKNAHTYMHPKILLIINRLPEVHTQILKINMYIHSISEIHCHIKAQQKYVHTFTKRHILEC